MIEAYVVDGNEFCTCDRRGVPITEGRAKKRDLPRPENELERRHLRRIKKDGFVQQQSPSAAWIAVIMGVNKASHMQAYSIAKFFSLLLEIEIPRESYRRRKSCLYWLDSNFEKIKNACSSKTILIIYTNGKVTKLTPPYDLNENIVPQKANSQASSISFTLNPESLFTIKDTSLQIDSKVDSGETLGKLENTPTPTFPTAIFI